VELSTGFSASGIGRLEVLSEDNGLVLGRGWREGAGGERKDVLIVVPASEQPALTTLDRLAHEYSLRDHLDAPWAVLPLDLLRERGRTMLVLADPGAAPLRRLLGSPMELGGFLLLAEALAAALHGLHERGLIHKDINPANILVDDSTSQVWLTGFGVASRLTRERQAPVPPEFIAGTLPYMAPEQTGRMNRSIDSRSDLYSLGMTFYQMLTGSLPFSAHEPLEWVHCHIARMPMPPRQRLESIPAPISQLVMKLLAKNAEDRYQTAAGVAHDLRQCRAEWETRGRIDEFPLAEHDSPDRLLIPEKLYGRSREVAALVESFDRVVATGVPEFVLVSGYSGVGKSSVVNELHKVLVPPRGLFAAGKFDQFKRDIPYATLAQAFQSLVRQILSKSEAELQVWRDAFREALGPNGRLIVDLIPELELVIGKQPPVPDLSPQDAQRRFRAVLRRFIAVFARPEHPLALFLDDLQWLDAATLDLLEDILTQSDIRHLLLIGAYRDNEVDAAHPLMRKIDAIRRAGVTIQDIVLAPLTYEDLEQLIVDSLHCGTRPDSALVQLVHDKTGGNPFFAVQFLHALADETLLVFDHADARWFCDLGRIHAKRYTDNVVDLMVERLNRLPAGTQKALQQLACLGNIADFAILRMVYQDTSEEMHGQLWEAVRTGLIFRSEDSYRFLHDRVQEAAYSLIPQELRAEAHLRIGFLMASHTSPDKLEDGIFEIANQLNRGSHLVTSIAAHEHIAKLNLIAGRRAKISTAYASALQYLQAGRGLLTDDSWNRNYDLVFSIEYLLAECELLTADMSAAENRLSTLVERAKNAHDIARVTRLRLTLYDFLGRSDRGVEVFIEYQRGHGKVWSPHPTDEEVSREYDQIWSLIGTRQIDELVDLPLITNPDVLVVLDVFDAIMVPAMFTDENLYALVVCRMVSLSLEHGNSDASCFAYVSLSMLAGPRFGNYEAGFRLGRLGYDLVEKHGLHRCQARVYLRFGNCIMPWRQHVKTGRELLRRAYDAANRMGDLTFAAYSYHYLLTNLLAAGDPLAEVQREAETGLEFTSKVVFGLVIQVLMTQLAFIRTLRGLTTQFGSLNDGRFDESQFERQSSRNPGWAFAECRYWIRKLQALFLAGDYSSAIQASSNAERLLWTSHSFFDVAEYHFYGALARAGAFDTATEGSRQEHVGALADHHRQLAIWAENCPENFENRAALVGAEIARIEGRDLDAMRLYEQAIRSARDHSFVQNEGVAYEVAARFYEARGFDKFVNAYLREACDCYLRWGADGKVRQLNRLYPHLAGPEGQRPAAIIGSPVQHLDVASVMKASQALSGEIELPKLIDRLMTIALENAGADRGLMILPSGDEYLILAEARATGDSIEVTMCKEPVTRISCPESLVRYVMRTQESVILDDAAEPNLFSEDPYFGVRRQQSVLCLPLIRQGVLVGLLYLENALASHVFTADRARLLELLASQAAISLENTRLYSDLQLREAKIRRLVDANIIGILIIDLGGQIIEANDAFLRMVGYEREDLVSGRIRWTELTPPDWRARDVKRVEQVKATGTLPAFEKEYFHKDGSRVPVLVGVARFEETGNQAVAFVLDLTERKQAEIALRDAERRNLDAQLQLAHVNRIETMGQLTASIAHEVNQPIGATLMNASTASRWLNAQPPQLEKAKQLIDRIAADSKRAGDIISRVRDLVKNAPTRKQSLELNETISEVIGLTRNEMSNSGVVVQPRMADDLPGIWGDRVQLQQVILNLIMNAIEAMNEVSEGSRELLIGTAKAEPDGVLITVSDSGPGLPEASPDRIFEAFYTTKASGLGMGLSICRSIVEAHGGRLWATPNEPRGAVFCMMLPIGENVPETLESPAWSVNG
jgi:PAS domain S-box-containing protein